MAKYSIGYSGWTQVIVEADSPEEAKEKFWEDGLNELNDSVVEDIWKL